MSVVERDELLVVFIAGFVGKCLVQVVILPNVPLHLTFGFPIQSHWASLPLSAY